MKPAVLMTTCFCTITRIRILVHYSIIPQFHHSFDDVVIVAAASAVNFSAGINQDLFRQKSSRCLPYKNSIPTHACIQMRIAVPEAHRIFQVQLLKADHVPFPLVASNSHSKITAELTKALSNSRSFTRSTNIHNNPYYI